MGIKMYCQNNHFLSNGVKYRAQLELVMSSVFSADQQTLLGEDRCSPSWIPAPQIQGSTFNPVFPLRSWSEPRVNPLPFQPNPDTPEWNAEESQLSLQAHPAQFVSCACRAQRIQPDRGDGRAERQTERLNGVHGMQQQRSHLQQQRTPSAAAASTNGGQLH